MLLGHCIELGASLHLWNAATPLAAPFSRLSCAAICSAFCLTWQQSQLSQTIPGGPKLSPAARRLQNPGAHRSAWRQQKTAQKGAARRHTSGCVMNASACCSFLVDSLFTGMGLGPTPDLKHVSPLHQKALKPACQARHSRGSALHE